MVKDGFYFLLPLLAAATLAASFHWVAVALVLTFAAAFVAWFFRDPQRRIPPDPASIVSPADGKVVRVDSVSGGVRVAIFLSVFDVHVNRAPIDGEIVRQEYRPGKFLVAWDDRATVENEQLRICLRGDLEVHFALIAGLVARRIVPWKKTGDRVNRGDRIGLIRFGSRVDILIPAGCRLLVKQGDRVRGGESVLALWESSP